MPNGHGGVVRWGGAAVAALFLAIFLLYGIRSGAEWTRYAGAAAAALFAWRLSWHYWIHPLNEYGGAYASGEALDAGRTLHRLTTGLLALVCAGLAWWLWP